MGTTWTRVNGGMTTAALFVFAVLAAIVAFAIAGVAPSSVAVSPDQAIACGTTPCGNPPSGAEKPGCGYGDSANHSGPPGHDKNFGNWDQNQRNGLDPADRECPGSAGKK